MCVINKVSATIQMWLPSVPGSESRSSKVLRCFPQSAILNPRVSSVAIMQCFHTHLIFMILKLPFRGLILAPSAYS